MIIKMTAKIIIDQIISGKLFHAECAEDKNHPCIVIWSSQAEEQIEAMLSKKNAYHAHLERIEELEKALDSISRHHPIMGSKGDYRQGQFDVLESVKNIAKEALKGKP